MSDGIEKLQECAYDMNQMQCDDVLVLADRIEREHVSELHALEERYNTDLREAREARDIAIKEASEYNNQLGNIIEYIGASIRKKPVLSSQDRYDRIISCMDRRLMPPGMEWPRFEDGMQITWDDAPEDITAVCLALDGSCYSLHYDMPDDERMFIYEVSDRVKRPVTEVLGADGLPIKVGDTVYDGTGNRHVVVEVDTDRALVEFDGEPKRGWRASFITHTPPDTQERIGEDKRKVYDAYWGCDTSITCRDCPALIAGLNPRKYYGVLNCSVAQGMDIARRKRELDAKTTGGE